MRYVQQLKELLEKFNQLRENTINQIKFIRESNQYTLEYQQQLIRQVKAETKQEQEQLNKEAIEIIENARNEILKGKTSAEKDQSFDLKLNNTLKVLEMVGADMPVEELRVLIDPFKEDYHTMKILRRIFLRNGMKGIDEIFGYDTIDSRVESWDNLRNLVNQVFNSNIETANTMKISILLNMNMPATQL